jgi:hypothetical protein
VAIVLAARASKILRRASALAITLLTTLAAHFQSSLAGTHDAIESRLVGNPGDKSLVTSVMSGRVMNHIENDRVAAECRRRFALDLSDIPLLVCRIVTHRLHLVFLKLHISTIVVWGFGARTHLSQEIVK